MLNIQDYLTKLEKELKYRGYSVLTIKAYKTCINIFLEKTKKDPGNIPRGEIIDFLIYLGESKKAPKTINLYKESIKFFYKEVLQDKRELNIHFSKEARKLPVILNRNEINLILENIKNPKHKLIIALSYGAGLRVSDITNLKIGDFDLENLTIHIKGGKGNKDRITIFPEKLINDICRFGAGKSGNDLLIESERGGKLTSRSLQKMFSNYLKKSGIKKNATYHSLRHSFATHLLENGTSIRYIQELLGHSNIRTTQIYTKVMNPKIRNIKSPL